MSSSIINNYFLLSLFIQYQLVCFLVIMIRIRKYILRNRWYSRQSRSPHHCGWILSLLDLLPPEDFGNSSRLAKMSFYQESDDSSCLQTTAKARDNHEKPIPLRIKSFHRRERCIKKWSWKLLILLYCEKQTVQWYCDYAILFEARAVSSGKSWLLKNV